MLPPPSPFYFQPPFVSAVRLITTLVEPGDPNEIDGNIVPNPLAGIFSPAIEGY